VEQGEKQELEGEPRKRGKSGIDELKGVDIVNHGREA